MSARHRRRCRPRQLTNSNSSSSVSRGGGGDGGEDAPGPASEAECSRRGEQFDEGWRRTQGQAKRTRGDREGVKGIQ